MSIKTTFSAADLANRIHGTLIGPGDVAVDSVSALTDRTPRTLTFIRTTSGETISRELVGRSEQVLLVPAELAPAKLVPASLEQDRLALIAVNDPYKALLDLLPLLYPPHEVAREIHPTALIHPSAVIGNGVAIGAHCVIGEGVSIGDGCHLYPLVSIYRDVTLGRSVTLHSGVSIREGSSLGNHITVHNNTVIGADGFGYVADPTTGLRKVPHVGNVIIADQVEIGANTSIDRGALGSTTIGFGTKIDNQVQIGHNVTIGKFCIICGQTGIAGSVTIGDQCVFGGGSGAVDHVTICSNVRLGGRTGAGGDIKEPGDYLGFPAVAASQWKRAQAAIRRLANPGRNVAKKKGRPEN
jgi:UDP-3-O-[3-hydroxymyristoyl] glucosamine N-acyltransferase